MIKPAKRACTHHCLVPILVVIAGATGQHCFGLLLVSDLIAGEKLAELLNTEKEHCHLVHIYENKYSTLLKYTT